MTNRKTDLNLETILKNHASFISFNSKKIEQFHSLIPAGHIKRVLSSMFFFIHANQPRIPGFINDITPHGIFGYDADADLKKHLKSVYPTLSFEKSKDEPFVQMIAVIGSAGTIAYNKKSDFDFWVCVDKRSVSEKKLGYFRSKIEKIQEWAEQQSGVEIHLFINDINDLKQNIFDEDEEEAFGSTLGALLKDEFYRSSIVLAGKAPFWWVVPSGTNDEDYNKLYTEMDPDIRDNSFIDIGNLYYIKKEDFIGAALFQIVKSLGNPFKSILKLGVLEKYLFESDSVQLISQQLKEKVHERKLSSTIYDSYLLMFAYVYRYYKDSGMDKNSLSILKMNLYLKISPNLSKYTTIENRKLPYKVTEMARYAKYWGWNRQFLSDLDAFENWDFMKVTKFWDQVKKFMLISYQKISREFTHFDLKSKISESDYTLLSRKIRGYFTVNPEKIEKYISFQETSGEPYLYLSEHTGQNGIFWKLHKKRSDGKDESSYVELKQNPHIVPLLGWAAINRVYEKSLTRISMNYQEGSIDTETIELLNLMADAFTGKDLKPKNSYYLRETFNLRSMIILNYGNRVSADSFQLDYICITSWNEAFHHSYKSFDSILEILPQIVEGGVVTKKSFDTVCRFYAPDKHQKQLREYYKTFKRCYDHISQSKSPFTRFLTKLNGRYLIVTCKKGKVELANYNSVTNFSSALSVSPIKDVQYSVLPNDDPFLKRLEFVLEEAQKEKITIYYDTVGKYVFSFTVNENRNVFISIKQEAYRKQLVSSLFHFAHAIVEDLRKTNPFSYLEKSSVEVLKISHDKLDTLASGQADAADLAGFSYSDGLRMIYRADNSYSIRYASAEQSQFMQLPQAIALLVTLVKQNIQLFKNHGGLCIHSILLKDFKQDSRLTTNTYFREKSKTELYFEKMLSRK